MSDLASLIENLKRSEIKSLIDSRISEFRCFKDKKIDDIFKELSFCLMTANCGAEKCIEVHEKIENDFLSLSSIDLTRRFKEYGYRYPNIRAQYIIEAREKKEALAEELKKYGEKHLLREWIVKNIKGLGYKESSHFLRNIGYEDYAIIDFHIIDVLFKYGMIDEKPKTLSKSKYLEIENILKDLGKQLNLNMAELDLYLWYMETGKVLK